MLPIMDVSRYQGQIDWPKVKSSIPIFGVMVKTVSTKNALRFRIMMRAFHIRLAAGDAFEDIAADYPDFGTDDLEAIKETIRQ